MNRIKVLIEGYAKVNEDGTWDATCTTTLIDTGKHKIVMDPCLLMGIFENATVFDSVQWQKGPIGGETPETLPDTDIQIIKTPGHTADHASLLVNTEERKILVGADVFWWAEGEEQKVDIDKNDEFAEDMESLKQSRKKALKIADFIIPGHGKKFKTSW